MSTVNANRRQTCMASSGPISPAFPESFGFRSGERGTHTSRTIMLTELQGLLAALPADATRDDYEQAITEDNVLGKKTASTRRLTAQRIGELYALDPTVPLFRLLRDLWKFDAAGRPLIACLCANARDPLLRITAPAVLDVEEGEPYSKERTIALLTEGTGDRFNPGTVDKIARNTSSSWTQSGHLKGRARKIRARAKATPSSTAYALLLGFMTGARGEMLYTTYWARLLDARSSQIDALAFEASRRGWLDYRRLGNVIEITFPDLLTSAEMETIREQG